MAHHRVYENFVVIDSEIIWMNEEIVNIIAHIQEDDEYIHSNEFKFKTYFLTMTNKNIYKLAKHCIELMNLNKEYHDLNVERDIKAIVDLSSDIEYSITMIDNVKMVNKYARLDISTNIKRIVDTLQDMSNIAGGICHSDYCYVERRLLTKESVYGDSKKEILIENGETRIIEEDV